MKDQETPMTPAVRVLRAGAVAFKPHFYTYVEQGVVVHAAAARAGSRPPAGLWRS